MEENKVTDLQSELSSTEPLRLIESEIFCKQLTLATNLGMTSLLSAPYSCIIILL